MRDGRRRDGAAPKAVVILVVLLGAAGALLLALRGREAGSDYTLGGPLFPVAADDIESLTLTRQGRQFHLARRTDGGWILSGAVSDFVETRLVDAMLRDLLFATGGRVLPGTTPEDRRYEFNGPQGLRLTVTTADGTRHTLSMGVINPVTGTYYASGLGREACFPVTAALRDRLAALPGSVQAAVLLPLADRDAVQAVEIQRGDRRTELERREGRWWFLVSAGGADRLDGLAGDYHALYDDRRRSDERGLWVLADVAKVTALIYQVSDIVVRIIYPPEETAGRSAQWGLAPPWRRIILSGAGLNPDPGDTRDRLVLDFGPPLSTDSVPVLRRGNVLVTDGEAVQVLDLPTVDLVDVHALSVRVMTAAALTLEREGERLVSGIRTDRDTDTDGRKAWITEFPPQGGGLNEADRHGLTRDLVVNLDRVPILAVLPATSDASVLYMSERITVTVVLGAGDGAGTVAVDMGYLDPAKLPQGTVLAPTDADRPAALWNRSDGQLLQIPDSVIVTARNIVAIAGGRPGPRPGK